MIPLRPQSSAAGTAADEFVDAVALEDLPVGGQVTSFVGFMRVLICRTAEDHCHAMADLCPHALQPLAGGEISAGSIRCVRHGACFDLASGKALNSVTQKPLTLYRTRIRAGRIEVAPPARK